MNRRRSIVPLLALLAILSCLPAGAAARFAAPTSTSLPAATPTNQDQASRPQGLHFGKYLATPAFTPSTSQLDSWEVYAYPTDRLKCVTGDPVFIRARAGTQSTKTVL
jgi:hypothetical protein